MKLVWMPSATQDRKSIVSYIWADNLKASRDMNARFRTVARMLAHSPYSGRPGAMPGTREFIVHPNYRLVYQLKDDTLSILTLIHTARQWPPSEDES